MKPITKVNPERCPIAFRALDALLKIEAETSGRDFCIMNGLAFIRCVDGIWHAAIWDASTVEPYENNWKDSDFGFGPAMAVKQTADAKVETLRAALWEVIKDIPFGEIPDNSIHPAFHQARAALEGSR